MQLRPYQREAVNAVYQHLQERDDNPCVVIPTAGGKTPIMATICQEAVSLWGGRVLILAHVKELLEQARDKLNAICPDIRAGVYSAGLGSRDTEHPVIIAGIQSVYRRAEILGHFDLCLVDECHMIPVDGEGTYRTLLNDLKQINPHLRVIGLTATPYRMSSGMICAPENILQKVCYEVGVKDLIRQGYLCPLISKASAHRADVSKLHIRGGEYKADEVEALMDNETIVRLAVEEIVEHTRERNSCLIFASSIAHGERIVRIFRDKHHLECGLVTGDTTPQKRAELLARFRGEEVADGLFEKKAPLKYLANINVLSTGFDAPNIDCVALLRPTMSPGLYYQQVGRGFRLHPNKQNCLVLDFGDNVRRHGPVDQISAGWTPPLDSSGEAPGKECPACQGVISAGYGVCPYCGFEFPCEEVASPHSSKASSEPLISGEKVDTEYPVMSVRYMVHQKRGADPDAPRSMRVEYRIGWQLYLSEWVCFEHTGFALVKAEEWWTRRSNMPVPETAYDAVEQANLGALCETKAIKVRRVAGEKYDRIIAYELGPRPEDIAVPVAQDDFSDFDNFNSGPLAENSIPF